MLRIGLFLGTNIAILILVSIIFKIFGIEGYLSQQGVGLNLTATLIMCGIFGFLGSFISLLISKPMAKRSTGLKLIETPANEQEKWLMNTVAELSRKAGIDMPEVGIFPAQQSNAFATGWNKNKALVGVSAGLLHRFDREEARAVMAHEIGHVANGDMVTLALVQGVVNTFVMFLARVIGSIIDRVVFKNDRGHGIGYFMIVMLLQFVLGIFASMIVMWFSRWREFRADAAGAKYSTRAGMIGALQRLQAETQAHIPNELPDTLTALGISSGWKKTAGKLFMTHPPLEERIEMLRRGL